MGREVKRVALDFNWPIGKIWYGYAVSFCKDGEYGFSCEDCRLFAKIKGIPVADGDCPKFETLDPPKGEGWQMWEDVSEGSPISPVCKTPEELAHWLADNNASACGRSGATYDQWLSMINIGSAPTMIMTGGKIMSGVEAAHELK